MVADLEEVTGWAIALLPIIVILMVFKWILKVITEMSDDGSSSYVRAYDTKPHAISSSEPEEQIVNEVQVKCNSCGAGNEELDAFCGYCGSALHTNGIAKISPVIVES